jgi:hypothetical protein
MILPGGPYQVYLAMRPVDFRKGHAGLSLIVQEVLGRDPFSEAIFVFRSRRGDAIKGLVWDQTGLVLIYNVDFSGRRYAKLEDFSRGGDTKSLRATNRPAGHFSWNFREDSPCLGSF